MLFRTVFVQFESLRSWRHANGSFAKHDCAIVLRRFVLTAVVSILLTKGIVVDDVALPPWAHASADRFIRTMVPF